MAKFQKGQGGRPKGAKNKISGAVKENIEAVFAGLGGVKQMQAWAQKNQTAFYHIYARILPLSVTGPDGGPIPTKVIHEYLK